MVTMRHRPPGPCWVVYRRTAEGLCYVASPASAREIASDWRSWEGNSFFSIQYVEPFSCEIDAIAAAIIIDGAVQCIEDHKYRDVGPTGPAWEQGVAR